MRLKIETRPWLLEFRKPAGTSRGVLKTRKIWIIRIEDPLNPGIFGYGECGPLPGLSLDDIPDFEAQLENACLEFSDRGNFNEIDLKHLPSIHFAFETALNDLSNKGRLIIFKNHFSEGRQGIAINGLVWMNDAETMYKEAIQKAENGYSCLKFKIGALDFDEECKLLEAIRKKFTAFKMDIRLDANGAFQAGEAVEKLKELSRFGIHSIEQPIKAGQWDLMQELCAISPIHIALDEELIGQRPGDEIMRIIKPHYLILKPSLLGGFQTSNQWIKLAEKHNAGWWATSALESNIGLNAIAQFTAEYNLELPQGLGTGGLYTNNFESPLEIDHGILQYVPFGKWEIPFEGKE